MEKNKLAYKILNQKHFSLLTHQNINTSKETSYITSIFALSFDNEIGQVVESSWPNGLLDKSTLKNLTGLSFPENNLIGSDEELLYVFKLRKSE